jgi:hypothetical protein
VAGHNLLLFAPPLYYPARRVIRGYLAQRCIIPGTPAILILKVPGHESAVGIAFGLDNHISIRSINGPEEIFLCLQLEFLVLACPIEQKVVGNFGLVVDAAVVAYMVRELFGLIVISQL